MPTSNSSSGKGRKISLPLYLPSNSRSWRDEESSIVGQNTTVELLTTLEHWIDDIANYFIDRHTSGFVEGFNNKLKVVKRRCYGILNVTHLFPRIHLDLYGHSLFAMKIIEL